MKQFETKYTWKQVSSHNIQSSCWIIDSDKVYDITPFMSKHPGGKDLLLLAGGRDCTNLIPSYHWWTDKPAIILKKFQIGVLDGPNEFPTFPPDTGLYADLRTAVRGYFDRTGLDPKGVWPGAWRLAFMFLVAGISYWAMYVDTALPWEVKLLASVVYGVFQALPLLHAMHDASHTAIGHSQASWTFFSNITMDLFAGASINSWLHQHVLSHHLYTNVGEVDSDLPVLKEGDLRRISPHQSWSWVYRAQWFYLPILYSLLGFKFRMQDITDTLISQTNGALRVGRIGLYNVVEQTAVKSFWLFWRLYIPVYWCNLQFLNTVLPLFVISELMTGLWLSWNFQVSHVSPLATFYEKADALDEWAEVQVKGSVDYAHGNTLATFLCGALNYQTVHHLFPAVSQYHYPALAPLIREVCEKRGVKYNYLDTFAEAFKQHITYLYKMGMEGKEVKMD